MPAETGYERQVAPRAAAPLPLASPSSYGAGLGATLAGAGAQLHEANVRAYRIERQANADRELTEGTARVAEHTVTLKARLAELRQQYPRGGPEYLSAVRAATGKEDELLGGVSEDHVRSTLQRSLIDLRENALGEAEVYSIVAGAKGLRSDADAAIGAWQNHIQLADDPVAAMGEAMGQAGGLIGGLGIKDPAANAELERYIKARLGLTAVTTKAAADPEAAALLATQFVDVFDAEQMDDAVHAVRLGQRQQEVAAKEAAAAAERAAKEKQDEVREQAKVLKIRAGREDLKPAEIVSVLRAGKAAGLPDSELLEIENLGADSIEQAAIRGMSPAALEAERERLDALRRAGNLDKAGARRQAWVDGEVGKRADDDGDELKTLAATDPAGAYGKLAAMPEDRRWQVAERAGLSPVVAGIRDPRYRDRALQGAALRKARPEDWLPAAAKGESGRESREREARAAFDFVIEPHLKSKLGGSYDELFDTAMNIMAASLNSAGSAGWHPKAFRDAVNVAAGASQRPGPGKVWQGGLGRVHGHIVELPDNWTVQEVHRAVGAQDFARAVYGDGTPAKRADVLAHYRMVFDRSGGDGAAFYRFEHDKTNQALLRDDGKPWLLRLAPQPGVR